MNAAKNFSTILLPAFMMVDSPSSASLPPAMAATV
ncbi:Uncharacterised protein [Bordetella pertussis]|nr:Uncharacterised protein [Bordetella pertussis]